MAEPPDQMPAAAGRGDLRASHAGREQVIGTLTAAFVQGRLAKDEFDLRVGQALASRTYAELAAVTAELPAGLTAAQPSKPARAGMWPVAFVLPRNSEGDPLDRVNLLGRPLSSTCLF